MAKGLDASLQSEHAFYSLFSLSPSLFFTQAQEPGLAFDLPAQNFVILLNIVGSTVSLFDYEVCEIYAAVTGGDFISMYTGLGTFQGEGTSPSVLLTSFASEV